MQKASSKKLGTVSAALVAILSFGAIAAGATVATKNQLGLTAVSLAKGDGGSSSGGSGSGGNGGDNGGGNSKSKSQDSSSKSQSSRSNSNSDKTKSANVSGQDSPKDQTEVQREAAKQQRDNQNGGASQGGNASQGLELNDNASNESGDNRGGQGQGGDNSGMFKDRTKTVSQLQEDIAKTEADIAKKQAEGADVTAAQARLAVVKTDLTRLGTLFDANDLEAAKTLAEEIKKTAHFTGKDIQDASKVTEAANNVSKRFGQVDKKIATLQGLGGDVTGFQAQLATLRSDFAVLQASVNTTPGAITRDTFRAFERKVKQLKNSIEKTIFSLGGTVDDDLVGDHVEDANDLSEDLNDVADIEEGDDNGVSKELRTVDAMHKAATPQIEDTLNNLKERGGATRILFGPDRGALDNLTAEIAAINARAVTLEGAAAKIADPQIKQILTDQAAALRSEATKLQAYITAKDNQFSIFGNLIKLFHS